MKRIDGVIGTTLFYHFLATLDFPRGELVLRRKNAESLKAYAAESSGQKRRGSVLDCERSLHGGLGPRGDDATCAPVRRHWA